MNKNNWKSPNQWEKGQIGRCNICRRKEYCSKPCKNCKERLKEEERLRKGREEFLRDIMKKEIPETFIDYLYQKKLYKNLLNN